MHISKGIFGSLCPIKSRTWHVVCFPSKMTNGVAIFKKIVSLGPESKP
jgi:hypothetical protein